MNKLHIAHLNTPIHKLAKLSAELGKNIFVKRDDYTGTEITGNKVRKLEYTMQYALAESYDAVITTGALQSNHARATAAVCAMLNLECHLVLRGDVQEYEGNFFLDHLFGAHVSTIPPDASREDVMEEKRKALANEGKKALIIPVGASDAIGSRGYIECYDEILEQEKAMDIHFDSINLPVGSGGTYAGLWYANEKAGANRNVVGYAVDGSSESFQQDVSEIVHDLDPAKTDFDTITINDDYVGLGYGKATDDELAFYMDIAQKEGLVLDHVYTGKAFRGLVTEIQAGQYHEQDNILFIHTGGIHGYTKDIRNRMMDIYYKEK